MAYQFIEEEDFDTAILKQLFNDRTADNLDEIKENIEKKAIAIISTKLAGRYDTESIFSEVAEMRHHLIVHYMTVIMIYLFLRRNAARKVSSDYKDDYKEVMKDLDKIEAGKMVPLALPKITDEEGEVITRSIYGNRRNNDFHI